MKLTPSSDKSSEQNSRLRIPVSDRVFCVEFFRDSAASPSNVYSQNLLALGLRSKLVLLQLKFPEESGSHPAAQLDKVEIGTLKELNHDHDRMQCLAWDPRTDIAAKFVRIVSGCSRETKVFTITEQGEEVRVLQGNAISLNLSIILNKNIQTII